MRVRTERAETLKKIPVDRGRIKKKNPGSSGSSTKSKYVRKKKVQPHSSEEEG